MPPKSKGKGKASSSSEAANASGGGSAISSSKAAEIMTLGSRRAMQDHINILKKKKLLRPDNEGAHPYFFSLPRRGGVNIERLSAKVDKDGKIELPENCAYTIYLNGARWGTISIATTTTNGATKCTLNFTVDEVIKVRWLSGNSNLTIYQYNFTFRNNAGAVLDKTGLIGLMYNLNQFMTGQHYSNYSSDLSMRGKDDTYVQFMPPGVKGVHGSYESRFMLTNQKPLAHKQGMLSHEIEEFNHFVEYYIYNMNPDGKGTRTPRINDRREPDDQDVRNNLYVMHAITRMIIPFAFLKRGNEATQTHANQAMLNANEALFYLAILDDDLLLQGDPLEGMNVTKKTPTRTKTEKGTMSKKQRSALRRDEAGEAYVMGGGGAAADSAAQMMGLFIDKTLCFTQEMSEA